jgi:glycosyltransferase involved in cell wall biosynthesis
MTLESAVPEISVIVPTHNRRDSILRLLGALGAGTFAADRFEIIAVCDGCTDDTVAVLSDLATPFRLAVVTQSPGRGAASARNLGARHARAKLLLFIDDDIEPLPTLLEAHAKLHRDAIDGEALVVVGAPLPVRRPDANFAHIAVWGWWEQQFERMSRPGHRFTYAEVFSGILSLQAAMFAEAGGFEPALNSCRDDSELGLRLIRLGARVAFTREGGGLHHEIRNHTQLLSRKRAEGRADVILARKHAELRPDLQFAHGKSQTLRLRTVRGLAMYAPVVGDAVQLGSRLGLRLLERMRLRGTWRAVYAASLYYAYWRGVTDTLGGARATQRELEQHHDAARRTERDIARHEIELDLADGLDTAMALLDRARPRGARVRFGDADVAHIAPIPGAEPLRGAHLRANLPGRWPFAANLALALTLRDMRHVPSARRTAGVPPQLEHWLRARIVSAQLTAAHVRPPCPDPVSWPRISVVVCTKDRASSLEVCLTSLTKLDYRDYEVVVVDNASATDVTRDVCGRFPVRYVREERPGLDWARNRGIAESQYEVIAFTDDDVEVDSGWLRGIARAFSDPEVMLVTGLIAPAELATAAQVAFEFAYSGMGKGFVERRWDPHLLDTHDLLGAHELGAGANMAFRRSIFDKIGTFDTALDVGTPSHGAGDLDMFFRVLASGSVAYYQPDALVWHLHRSDFTGLKRQLRDNGRSFGAYLITRWMAARRGVGPVTPSQVVSYAIRIWLAWRVGRVLRRYLKRDQLSLPLQAAELTGVLQAPWAYVATQRSDKKLRTGRHGA